MPGMPQNFLDCDREQAFLMPPSLRDWLPEDHLAWFVLDTVSRLDLAAFYASYRPDGHGRAAYEPSMMVALLLYSYSTKVYSSRDIECHCRQDIAYRVITANRVPDHSTVARFVIRHEGPLGELFGGVLKLCERAGLVSSGVVAIHGSKMPANASRNANVDYGQIAREIIAEAIATDQAEDEQHGDARGTSCRRSWRLRRAGGRGWRASWRPTATLSRTPTASVSLITSLTPSRSSLGCRVATGGCLRPSASSIRIAGRPRIRSPGRGLSGCGKRVGGWRRISPRRPVATRSTRRIALGGG